MTTPVTRSPGRPRSEKAEKAIIEATLDLLGEGVPFGELTIEAVAHRAGVGKTTIYRRWPGKEELILDALAALKSPLPEPAGRSVREDLVTILTRMQEDHADTRHRCVMQLAMSESDRFPRLMERLDREVIEPRREVTRSVLRRGVETGELRPDVDLEAAMAALSGAVIWRVKGAGMSAPPIPADFAERVVDTVLAGLAPTGRETS